MPKYACICLRVSTCVRVCVVGGWLGVGVGVGVCQRESERDRETWMTLWAANLCLLLWKLTSTFSHDMRDRPVTSSSAQCTTNHKLVREKKLKETIRNQHRKKGKLANDYIIAGSWFCKYLSKNNKNRKSLYWSSNDWARKEEISLKEPKMFSCIKWCCLLPISSIKVGS